MLDCRQVQFGLGAQVEDVSVGRGLQIIRQLETFQELVECVVERVAPLVLHGEVVLGRQYQAEHVLHVALHRTLFHVSHHT